MHDTEHVSPMTGSLTRIKSPLPSNWASQVGEKLPPSSATIGEPSQGNAAGKSIGQPHGATGAVALRDSGQAVRKAFGLPSENPSLKHLPVALLSRLIVWGETSLFSEAGFEGVHVTDVAVVSGADHEDLRTAAAAIERICEPCGAQAAGKKLTELRALTVARARADIDNTAIAAAYTPRLAQYPADVVVAACDGWANREEFWPSWAELKAECDKRMRGRVQIRMALREAMR